MIYASLAVGPRMVGLSDRVKKKPVIFKVVVEGSGEVIIVELSKAERNRLIDELRDSKESDP